MKRITIGTRASKLAIIQTHQVIEQLHQHWPDLEVAIEHIHTVGDRQQDKLLTQIGGDGVFVTAIEQALHERRIDLAVHSLKDLPTTQPPDLYVMAIAPREDVRDVLLSRLPLSITKNGLQLALSKDATEQKMPVRIGTCSLRRSAQLQPICHFPVEVVPIRGNVDTRLRKLVAGEYDGVVLAAAGIHRVYGPEFMHNDSLAEASVSRGGYQGYYFPTELMMPAPGQGTLAVEIRDELAMHDLIAPISDATIQSVTSAERMFMRRLSAGCYLPVAAYGELASGTLTLHGLVTSLDGQRQIRISQSIPWTPGMTHKDAEQLGITLAEQALAQGANKIIAEVGGSSLERTPSHLSRIQPLHDKHILVTRTREQASVLSERLRILGATPIEFPMIHIVPPPDWQPLDNALRKLFAPSQPGGYDWLIFTSANGVKFCCEHLHTVGYDPHIINTVVRVVAIGPATAAALEPYGITADLVPSEYIAESIVAALIDNAQEHGETLANKHILLARAAEARNVLVTSLQQAGAIVDLVAAYQTIPASRDDEQGRHILALLQSRQLDMITFTSSSTVRNFMQWLADYMSFKVSDELGRISLTSLITDNPHLKIACIGPITSQTARDLGLPVHIKAQVFTIDGLIEAIIHYEEDI